MAASSNSFLLSTTLPNVRSQRQLTVSAKNGSPFPSFRPGKPSGDEESEQGASSNTNSNPFKFNWGKLPDVKSLIPVVSSPPVLVGPARRKDAGTVFVAGATGQLGSRVSQMLLRQGFRVRAGVSDLAAAQDLARFASLYKLISTEESKRLNAVESGFEDAESIAKAIGNASKVVVTIGATENGPIDKVTISDALQVVEAAQLAGVGHVAIIYDRAPTAASPTTVFNGISTFFNNLFSRSQPLTIPEFLDRLIQTDVRYTFIMSTLTDDFSPECAYNVVVATEQSASETDYKVGRSQMAALVAELFSNTSVAEDKVVEVYTDPSAPSKPLDELFSVIPEDGRRKAYAEAIAKAKAEEEVRIAEEQAREAAEAKRRLEEEMKKVAEQEARASSLAEEAKQKAEEAGTSMDGFAGKAKELATGFSWDNFGSQLASAVKPPSIPISKVQIATVRGQAKAQKLPAQKAITKPTQQPKSRPKPKPEPEIEDNSKQVKVQVNNILGGLFKQETIYVDEE